MHHPVVCGVYCLFLRHELVYVGKSKDAYARIASHRTNGREFDYATVATCPEADLVWIEAAMIKAMEPRQNRSGKDVQVSPLTRGRPVNLTIVPPAPAKVMTSDMLLTPPKARSYLADYQIPAAVFLADLRSGALRSFPKGSRTGPGAPRVILFGDLLEWSRPFKERLSTTEPMPRHS